MHSHMHSHLCSEFLDSVLVIYKDLLAGKSPNTMVVPTSSSEEQPPPTAPLENQLELEDMEASVLAEGLHDLCERFTLR